MYIIVLYLSFPSFWTLSILFYCCIHLYTGHYVGFRVGEKALFRKHEKVLLEKSLEKALLGPFHIMNTCFI